MATRAPPQTTKLEETYLPRGPYFLPPHLDVIAPYEGETDTRSQPEPDVQSEPHDGPAEQTKKKNVEKDEASSLDKHPFLDDKTEAADQIETNVQSEPTEADV